MGAACNTHKGEEKCVQILAGKLEGKRRIWEGNIKTDLIKIKCRGVDWIQLVQDRVQWQTLVDTAMDPTVL